MSYKDRHPDPIEAKRLEAQVDGWLRGWAKAEQAAAPPEPPRDAQPSLFPVEEQIERMEPKPWPREK